MSSGTSGWVRAVDLEQLRINRCKVVEVADVKVLIVRTHEKVYATQALCSHVRTPLGPGRLSAEGYIECPMHGALFRPHDGRVEKGPAKKDLTTYPARVVDGFVELELPVSAGPVQEEEANVRSG